MELFLTPTLVARIVYAVGLSIAIAYLVFLPKKSADAKLILALLVAWFIGSASAIAYEVTHLQLVRSGQALTSAVPLNFTNVISFFGFQIILGVLSYRVGFRFVPREEKGFLAVSALMTAFFSFEYVRHIGDVSILVLEVRRIILVTIVWNVWAIVVGARKLLAAYSHGHEFRSKRLVTVAILTSVTALIYVVSRSYMAAVWPFSAEARGIGPVLAAVIVAGSLIIGYLLYGQERHSLLVKLVGFLLIAYVAIFSIVVPLMRTEIRMRQEYLGAAETASLRFTPDSFGGYSAEYVPTVWLEPTGDTYIVEDDAAVFVRSAFPVPFFGAEYDSLWVGTNGSLSFGAFLDTDNVYDQGQSFFGGTPTAALYYTDLVMAGSDAGIIVDASENRFLVTWMRISIYDLHESTFSMQAALYPDGRIEFNYDEITTIPLLSYKGISPGGDADPIRFSDRRVIGRSGQALFEHADHRLSYRRSVHELVVSVAWVGVYGLFLVLLGGIAFYRVGILNPLKRVLIGLNAVEKGDLETEVLIAERNELGDLADHYNRMRASLREYSDRMGEMVAMRTVDLDKTIADLRTTQKQLIEQEKLASLGALTAGIAHEIKNPLNFVNNFAEVGSELAEELVAALSKGDAEEAEQILAQIRVNAEQIAKHGKRADSIVRSMMQHARGGTSELEEIDVNAFVEEYANLAWHGMRARDHGFQADVIRELGDEVGTLTVFPQELGRVLLNLLTNAFGAVKGMDGAVVVVSTRKIDGFVEISVSDNGPGIPENIRPKIFEPFFTTKATGEGTGLGLSLSYDIVTKGHGGSLTVQESPSGGAEFVISLPPNQIESV